MFVMMVPTIHHLERARFFRSCNKNTQNIITILFFQRTNTCFLGPKLTSFLAPTPPTRPLQPPFPNPGCELGADREPPEIERSS